jgi:hypothetical protein
MSLYKKALAAVHYHVSDKRVSKLVERDSDIFEWEMGWKIPSRS